MKKSFFQVSEFWGIQYLQRSNSTKKATTFLSLLFLLLFTNLVSGQSDAPHISSGVTFQWDSSQPTKTSSASIKSITINGAVYNSFKAPSIYELTQVGPNGNNSNAILFNGTTISNSSSNTNWNSSALNAFQDRNLNHYFTSSNNGRNLSGDYAAENTTDSQRQTLTFSNTIASAGSVLAVTERNANNEYHVKIYGFLAGSTTETVLGETFVITDNGTMKGYGGLNEYYQAGMGVNDGSVTPPTTQSSYWLTNRVVENNGTIGVALFHMEDIVTIGSEISKVQLTAATNDHGDGKLFVITLDDENTDDYKDLDDDDDGILDINERNCTFIDTKSASAILADTGVTNETQVLFDNGNNGAQFDAIGDKFIIDLGSIVTAGTVLKMDTRSSSSTEQEYTIEQSNLDGSSTSNTKIFTKSTTSSEVIDYELTKNTRYIKISMTAAKGGILYLDYLEIQGHYVCTNIDTDQDGVPDYLDLDSDNDGISDVIEVGGTDVDKNGKADGDEGTGTTTNGIPATANTGLDLIDSDSDGIPNNLDIDTDNDGIPDNIEGQTSIGYMPPSGIGTTITDINKNGVDDVYEDIPNSLVGLDPVNTDGTDTDDFIDADSDNDGISDMDENGHVNKVPAYTDADGDGLDDNFDDNNDSSTSGTTVNDGSGTGDKITDTSSLDTAYGDEDNDFPGAGNVDYRDLIDSDNDGVPNVYDLDDDNDGILDTEEGFLITPGQPACGLETTFKFNNAYTEETGDGDVTTFLKGEVFRFTNVASGIDALVTIVNFNNVTSIPKFDDNSSNPDSFQPQSSFSLTNIGDQAYVEYKFDFVTAGTTTPVIIPKFIATFNDVDGNNNYGEQNWSSITTDYVLENPTELSINNYGTWITATSGTNEYTNVTNNFPQVNYSTEHNGKSSYSIRLGIIARATGASGNGRQHNVKFACPTNFNDPYTYKTNIDTDGDGIPNTLDLDSDNDGIPDVIEAGGVDANKDGIADGPIGTTTDTKGIPNSASTGIVTINSDNDTIPNYLDIDSDDDGIPDNIEGQTSNDYIAPSGIATSIVDANNNGIDDNYEIIGGNIGLDPVNTDGTDTDDYIDTDSDNDGIDDVSENGDTEIATSGLDTDGDGLDDNFDDNDDSLIAGSTVNDGLGTGDTVIDKATLEAAFDDTDADFNPGNGDLDYRDITDTDGDGVADALDLDNDNDGILDTDELCKNLIINGDFELQDFSSQTEFPDPVNTNPEGTFMGDYNTNTLTGWNYTQNIDGWVGGKSPYWSPNTFANAYHGKQYLDLTGSNQIVINGTTTNYTTNNVLSQTINTVPGKSYTLSFQWGEDVGHWAGSTVTLDVGILDANNGTIHSETLTANTEGIVNGIIGPKTWFSYTHDFIATTTQTTIQFTADPPSLSAGAALDYVSVTDINCSNDTDNDGIPNHLDLDSDNDGIPDVIEAGGIDVNRDGLADDDDNNVDNTGSNGIPTSAGSGATPTNTDADELPNYLDIDSDNDGIPDNIEGQLSDDYIAPSGVATTITDDNDNGIDDNYEIGGNIGLEPVNTDGTDTPDYIDSDSDNDGILDAFENGDTDNIPSGVDTDNDGLDDAFDDNNDFTLVGSTVNDGLGANDKVTDETSLDAAYGDNDNDFPGTGDLDYRDSPDADNDGIPDNVDLDDDNDGILDTDECSEIVDFDVNLNNHDYDSGSYANGSDVQRKFDIDISANAGSYFQNNNIISFDIYYSIPYYGIQGTQSATGNLNNIEINFSAGTFSDSNAEFDDSNFCASTKRIWVAGSFQVEKDGNIMTIQIPNTDFNFCGSGNDPFNIPTLYAGVCDIDNDGIPNHLDLDSDNDGIPDLVEAGGVDINGDGVIDAINTDGTLVNDANNDGYDDHSATNNSGNPDTDNDGIPNSQDLDSDNDGIPDVVEAGGIDNNGDGRADGFADTDNDGFNDLVDGDVDGTDNSANALIITGSDNGNGQPDSYPNGDNKDYDGFPDFLDLDSDNDGIPDIIEAGGIDNNGDGVVDNATDVDQDGLADIYDQDTTDGPGPDGTNGIALVKTDASGNMISGDGNSIDTDGDGLPNHLDIDSDNDGIPDLTEAGGADTNNDGVVDDLTDADGDGLADVYDTDDDGTPGVEDTTDALLQTAGNDANGNGKADDTEITFVNGYNQNADTDRDGLPNYVDLDSDNDGIADLVEAGGVDTDGNGLVDNINTDGTLKIDTDGDGLDDTYQTNEGGHPIGNLDSDNDDITDYKDLDSDNDGIPDVVEAGGTDVNGDGRADGFIDADNDGFNDLVDGDVNGTDNSANALIITGTDSDNDGKPDTYTTGDNDGDGIPNHLDIDSDNDGITDITEAGGSDANRDGIADDFRDDDKDGFNDLVDGDPTNVLDVTVDTAGANTANALVLTGTDGNNDGKPDTYTTGDFDNDGKLDFLDIDADNDGIPDNIEGQPTRDYVAPSGMATDITDANNNGLDDNYEVGDAFGIAPENTDGTDNVDYLDTDSDNDGILDAVENGDTNNTASGTDSDGDGLDDSFERADIDDAFDVNDEIDIPNKDSLGDEDNDATSIGDVDYRDATSNGIPMITQVYQVGTERWIEITNIGVNDIPANLIKVQLYQNRTGNQTIAPTASYTVTTVLEGGKSVLFKNCYTMVII